MSRSTGVPMTAHWGGLWLSRPLYKLSQMPTPRVKVKQPKIPGVGNHGARRYTRELVVMAKLMYEVMPVSAVAMQLSIPASAIKSWVNQLSCRDWEPTPAERTKFYSERA